MSPAKRGFASMDRSLQRQIARAGGRASAQSPRQRRWTEMDAAAAGRKGGLASAAAAQRRREDHAREDHARGEVPPPGQLQRAETEIEWPK
jgi:general stress protein YciG